MNAGRGRETRDEAPGPGKCPGCGRKVKGDRERCLYCGADITAVEAARIEGQCPRCSNGRPLEMRSDGEFTIYVCADCQGIWIPRHIFEKVEESFSKAVEDADREKSDQPEETDLDAKKREDREQKIHRDREFLRESWADHMGGYLWCPACHQQMSRRQYLRLSGIMIDECLGCGVWFDSGEFDRAMEFLKSGGQDLYKKRVAAEMEALDTMRRHKADSAPERRLHGFW